VIDGWFPELCAITLPLYKRYADRIGAEFHIITERKFPDFPPNYERLQVYELGRDCDWNICLDADYIIDPEQLYDPCFAGRGKGIVYMEGGMQADFYFDTRAFPCFGQDGRNQGVGDAFIVSSSETHSIWTPLSISYKDAARACLISPRQVSELCLSINLATYHFGFDGAILDKSKIFHLAATTHGARDKVLWKAKQKLLEMKVKC
jgi:hypothetical protein